MDLMFVNDYFDKIFYINLKKDIDRNKNILSQFEKFGIKNYERFEAISFDLIPNENLWRNFNKKNEKYILNHLGSIESHLKIVNIAKERNYKRIFILEDDVQIDVDPSEILTLNDYILNDWDMLYFGGLIEHYFRNQIVCAHAYCLNNTLFDDIINMCILSGMEVDNFYAKIIQHMSFNNNQSGKYNIRILMPFNTIQQNTNFISNIK